MGDQMVAAARDPFEALGDPHRRAIVAMLGEGERSVGELAADLPISRPAVSRHLRLLREAGLVAQEDQGTRHVYRLDAEGAAIAKAFLEQVWGPALARFALIAENTTPASGGDG